jgi:hypothetical protein
MSCTQDLINGMGLPCKTYAGGIKEIYIAKYNRNVGYTYDANGDTITAMTNSLNVFKIFEQPFETATFDEASTSSDQNFTVANTSTLVAVLPFVTPETRNYLKILLAGQWTVIVKDNNNNYIIMGVTSPVSVNTAASSLGRAMEDLNGRTVTFTTKSKDLAYFVDPTIIDNLVQLNDLVAPTITLTALSATASSFTWTSVPDATAYQMEQSTSSTFSSVTTIYTGTTASYTVTGLTTNTNYYFRVKGTAPSVTSSNYGTIAIKTP